MGSILFRLTWELDIEGITNPVKTLGIIKNNVNASIRGKRVAFLHRIVCAETNLVIFIAFDG